MLAGHESCNEQVGAREAVRQFILGNWKMFFGAKNSQELTFAFLSEPSELPHGGFGHTRLLGSPMSSCHFSLRFAAGGL